MPWGVTSQSSRWRPSHRDCPLFFQVSPHSAIASSMPIAAIFPILNSAEPRTPLRLVTLKTSGSNIFALPGIGLRRNDMRA